MPTLERAGAGGILAISGFTGNGFRIGEGIFPAGMIIWPEGAGEWTPPALSELEEGDFSLLNPVDPPLDLILIGTGAALRRPSRLLIESLNHRHIGVEPMDSRAAARTYNLLAGEGRRVGAALYPLNA